MQTEKASMNDAYKYWRAQGEGMNRAFALARAEAVCKREGITFEWEEEEYFFWKELAKDTGLSIEACEKKFDLFCLVAKRGKEILDSLGAISFFKVSSFEEASSNLLRDNKNQRNLNRGNQFRIFEADMALNVESLLHDEWQVKADELANRATYAGINYQDNEAT